MRRTPGTGVTGLYRPCDTCRSTDVHRIPALEHATVGTADVAAAIERERATPTAASRVTHAPTHTRDGAECGLVCAGCGQAPVVITIRASTCFTVSRCPQCDRRAWTIDGVDASLADVLATMRSEQLALVPRRRRA